MNLDEIKKRLDKLNNKGGGNSSNDYKNCILLIQTEGFNKIDTKIREIIKL